MTSYDEVKDFILTTDANTRKNYSSATFAFNSSAVSVPSNGYIIRPYDVPLSGDTRDFQLMLNMSDEDSLYRPVERYDRRTSVGDGLRIYSTVVTASGGQATVYVYMWNTSSGTTTFPAFTLNVIRRDFVDEL